LYSTAVAEISDAVALWRDRRPEVQHALVAAMIGESARERLGMIEMRHRGPPRLAQVLAPQLVVALRGQAVGPLERAVEAYGPGARP
jgi:hypothetical protein